VPINKLAPNLGERPLSKSNNILIDFADAEKVIK
jgi:hypothetical protein